MFFLRFDFSRLFVLLLAVSALFVFAGCTSSSGLSADGDTDNSSGELEQSLNTITTLCYSFCDRKYQCDTSGAFIDSELESCKAVCLALEQTCINQVLLSCADELRCDTFNTCVSEKELATDCSFPIDGDIDSEQLGLVPVLNVPETIDFGAVVMGQSTDRMLVIANEGRVLLEVYDLLVSDNLDEFTIDFEAGHTLAVHPGESIEINITYFPLDVGRDEAKLLVYTNDPNNRVSPVMLVSAYKGNANIEILPAEIDFGLVAVGAESKTFELSIYNRPGSSVDNKVLTISELAISNNASGAFSFKGGVPALPIHVVPDERVTLQLLFSPKSWGQVSDVLSITSDSSVEADRLIDVALSGTGAAKRLCVYPDPIPFGSVRFGESVKRSVELEACGSTGVTVSFIALQKDDSPFVLLDLPQIGEDGLLISLGERVQFEIEFTPTNTFSQSDSLIVRSDDLFFPEREIAINGQGSISSLQISPSYLSFGDVSLGSIKKLSLNLRNDGTWPLVISDAVLDQQVGIFEVEDRANVFPLTLDAGEEFEALVISFEPVSEGSFFDNLTFVSDNSDGNITVGLSGRATASVIELSKESGLDFGDVQLDTVSERIITVTNKGRAALTLLDYQVSSTDSVFMVSPESSSLILNSNESIDLTISFTPLLEGQTTGVFEISSDATDTNRQLLNVDLTGFATDPTLEIDQQSPIDFGSVFLGANSDAIALTLTNTKSGTLLLYSISKADNFDDGFLQLLPENDFPVLLRPFADTGDHYTFYVSFSPTQATNYQSYLNIELNDADNLQVRFDLLGLGANCPDGFFNYDDNPADCEYECHNDVTSTEICNGEDDNCDGQIDEGLQTGELCSGVGVCPNGVTECHPTDPEALICSTHIEGSDYQGNDEICNNLDDDCDGLTDEDFSVGDSCDGMGECAVGVIECRNAFSTRCSTERGGSNDMSSDEICDLLDNDCDGETDENFSTGITCSGVGLCLDGVWECDGSYDLICSTLPGGSGYPSQEPSEICDSQDNDCDGLTDEDYEIGTQCLGEGECGLGFWECDTGSSRRCSTNPGGSEYPASTPIELCDDLDNDCDGLTDEDYDIGDACDGAGECGIGAIECKASQTTRCSTDIGGSDHDDPIIGAKLEVCDGIDNDCDGLTDENTPNLGYSCDGVGECGIGTYECESHYTIKCSTDIGGSEYEEETGGSVEICDNLDNDCDANTDEGFALGISCDGAGECGFGEIECDPNNALATICSTDPSGSEPEDVTEICDGLDNDCDQLTDEVCRSNIYRSERQVATGDFDYRLSDSSTPEAGFTEDPVNALFSVYNTNYSGMVALSELTNASETDTIYTSSASEIATLESNGWINEGVLGYISPSSVSNSLILYRHYNLSLTAHKYCVSQSESEALEQSGYLFEDITGWIWTAQD